MRAEVIPFALATAASPLPLFVLLVMLLTPRAVPNGLAFALGWAAALLGVGVATVALLGRGAGFDEQSSAVSALEVVVGLGLLYLAARQWKRRPRGGADAAVPRWLVAADRCTPFRALAIGGALVVANPKNLALSVAAAGTVAATTDSVRNQTWALLAFAVLGTAGLGVPLALRITLGDRAAPTLMGWRRWLVKRGAHTASAVLAVIGLALVLRGATD